VGSLLSSVNAGVEGNVELLDPPTSSGSSEKSFVIPTHPKLSPLLVDFFELEAEFLLLDFKTPVDNHFFSLFSTKASKQAEPIVLVLSLFGFCVTDSVVVGSELSGIVSWTTPRSPESRPVSETFPKREDRDLPLFEGEIIASILSLLSSSLGVEIEEVLDVVIVGDSAGRLDLVVSECVLCLFVELPRVGSSAFSLTSMVVRLMTIGGGRLLSRGDGVEGSSGKLTDEHGGESGRGMLRGSTVSVGGIGGSVFSISTAAGSSSGMSGMVSSRIVRAGHKESEVTSCSSGWASFLPCHSLLILSAEDNPSCSGSCWGR